MTEPSEIQSIEVQKAHDVAVVRFCRPERKNRLSTEVMKRLEQVVLGLDNDKSCCGIVFTGSGNTFAAGANIGEVAKLNKEEALAFARMGQRVFERIRSSSKRTVAAVNGFCMGGALDLALSCGSRIVSANAIFAHPGVKLGIITGWGGTQLLPRLVGRKNAYQMFLTADRISAEEALRIGLVDEVSADPLERAVKYCREQ